MFDLVNSNALRILITLLASGALYLFVRRVPNVISAIGFATSGLLAASFILDVGEVYNYASYYKRAFWYFGDDVTTWLGAIFVWAVLSKRPVLSIAVAMGILFSGTKISLVVLAAELATLWYFSIVDRKWFAADVSRAFGTAGATYLLLVLLSPSFIIVANGVLNGSITSVLTASTKASSPPDAKPVSKDDSATSTEFPVATENFLVVTTDISATTVRNIAATGNTPISTVGSTVRTANDSSATSDALISSPEDGVSFERASRGNTSCVGLACVYPHVQRPLEDRLYSSIGGLWMAWQGDFAGSNYPNSSEKFADLMMEANPWGINDRFDITLERWLWIGGVQTSYLQFGAGYGIVLMSLLLLAIGVVGLIGVRNIMDGERGSFVGFTLFFIVNAMVNITQPWLNAGPVLLLMGFCGTHILFWRLQHIQIRRRRLGSVASGLLPSA